MIQFNLLPDVKIAYIKAQRQKRLVMTVSFIASGAAIAVFVLLFVMVNLVQQKSMNDLTKDISSMSKELLETPNLNKMLTVQSQLTALDGLHADKAVTSRLFEFVQKVTPGSVKLTDLKIDYESSLIEISGETGSLAAVYGYADSLKYTQYIARDAEEDSDVQPTDPADAFSVVTLTQYDVSDKGIQFTFTMNFEPTLFDQSKEITLVLQRTTTTRSDDALSGSLFQSGGGQ